MDRKQVSRDRKLIAEVERVVSAPDNLNLYFNKYRYWVKKRNGKGKKVEKIDFNKLDGIVGKLSQDLKFKLDALLDIAFYHDLIFPESVKIFEVESSWRLVVGLGASHVAETSITLNHITGIPYIPGSVIKGVLNTFWIKEKVGEIAKKIIGNDNFFKINKELKNKISESESKNKKLFPGIYSLLEYLANEINIDGKNVSNVNEISSDLAKSYKLNNEHISFIKKMLSDGEFLAEIKIFQTAFGTQKKRGEIVFMDAYPIELNDLFVEDVITPHFQDYYTHRPPSSPPTDNLNPNPIYFISIRGIFRFIILYKPLVHFEKDLLNLVYNNLVESLSNLGVGAKTSVGYGYFDKKSIEDKTNSLFSKFRIRLLEEQRRQKEEKESKMLDNMSLEEKYIFKLKKCMESKGKGCNKVALDVYNNISKIKNPEKRKEIALLLKKYWKLNGKWPGSKKQKNRVNKIRDILDNA